MGQYKPMGNSYHKTENTGKKEKMINWILSVCIAILSIFFLFLASSCSISGNPSETDSVYENDYGYDFHSTPDNLYSYGDGLVFSSTNSAAMADPSGNRAYLVSEEVTELIYVVSCCEYTESGMPDEDYKYVITGFDESADTVFELYIFPDSFWLSEKNSGTGYLLDGDSLDAFSAYLANAYASTSAGYTFHATQGIASSYGDGLLYSSIYSVKISIPDKDDVFLTTGEAVELSYVISDCGYAVSDADISENVLYSISCADYEDAEICIIYIYQDTVLLSDTGENICYELSGDGLEEFLTYLDGKYNFASDL